MQVRNDRRRAAGRIRAGALIAVALWLCAALPARAGTAPAVVASIKPLHALVAAAMRGVGSPALLVGGAGSPHAFALRPSQARLLQDADAVFWIGAGLEQFLVKPLATLPRRARIVALSGRVAGLKYRVGGLWAARSSADDPHIWLDPVRARAIVAAVVETLVGVDPTHGDAYRKNGAALIRRLRALDARLDKILTPVRAVSYLVFHDAYGYFEARYGLNAVGAVTLDPERRPGARRLAKVRRRIAAGDIRCLFREPQFEPALIESVLAGTPVRIAVLDPVGAALKPGPDAYFELLEGMARSLTGCLKIK